MVVYNEYENHKQPIYSDSYCNCTASQRISLNKTNGDLTIFNVSLDDQGDYFYWFLSEFGFPNTGRNYQINLQVYGKLSFEKYYCRLEIDFLKYIIPRAYDKKRSQSFFLVSVTPNEKDIKIDGMPDEVREGDEVNMKCTVDRVKPRLSDMYWKMNFGFKEPGNITISVNDDGTFKYENVITKV